MMLKNFQVPDIFDKKNRFQEIIDEEFLSVINSFTIDGQKKIF